MTDYSKLVRALRCKRDDCEGCDLAFFDKDEGWMCRYAAKDDDAAAAIEALQAEVDEVKQYNTDLFNMKEMTKEEEDEILEYIRTTHVRPIEPMRIEQLPKRGEWVEENRRPRSSQFVCSECHRTAYDPQPTRDKAWRKRCRYAYCPNCGAKMEMQDG